MLLATATTTSVIGMSARPVRSGEKPRTSRRYSDRKNDWPDHDGGAEHGEGVRDADAAAPEQADVEQRLAGAPLDHAERDEQGCGGGEARAGGRGARALGPAAVRP
jgi:hypothetical protein